MTRDRDLLLGVIDCHSHFVPEAWLAEIISNPTQFGLTVLRTDANYEVAGSGAKVAITPEMYDIQARLRQLDDAGIDVQLISPPSTVVFYEMGIEEAVNISRALNEAMASVAKESSGRIRSAITLPMQFPDRAATELRRCVNDSDAQVCFVLSNVLGVPLDDARFYPIWELAGRTGIGVQVHPPQDSFQELLPDYFLRNLVGNLLETGIAASRLIASGTLDRVPDVEFLLAHGGGVFALLLGRLQHGHDTVSMARLAENDPRDYVGRFYVDSVVHDIEALRFIAQTFGTSRIVVGSDMPYPMGLNRPGEQLDRAGFEHEQHVFRGNAQHLVGG